MIRPLAAVALAAAAIAVHFTSVSGEFTFVQRRLLTEERPAAGGAVHVVLPRLTDAEPTVLVLHLHNAGDREQEIAIRLGMREQSRLRVPAGRTVRTHLTLSPGAARALAAAEKEAARSLILAASGDGWSLRSLEVRNYHVRAGGRLLRVALLPERARPTATRLPLPAIVILTLALLSAAVPAPRARRLRHAAYVVTAVALVTCVAIVVLPEMSSYRVLLSPAAFYLLAALLFPGPVVLWGATAARWAARVVWKLLGVVARTVDAFARRMAVLSPFVERRQPTLERGAALLGLTALSVAHPLFEVIRNSPEFFVARNTSPGTAAVSIGVICLGVPLTLLAAERAVRAVSRRGAAVVFGLMLVVLGSALAMPWLKRSGPVAWPWDAVLSVALGTLLAVIYFQSKPVRQFLSVLALGAVVVPGAFLLDGSLRGTLSGKRPAAGETRLGQTPPIVLIVFDEFPLNSLLDTDGRIDAGRYPNFAAFAARAYWFRNAATVSSETKWAVPAILSGRYPIVPHDLPTLRYYPINLFTLLAPQYDILAFMRFRRLCPAGACRFDASTPPESVTSLLTDLSIVWLHIVLPQPATARLPPIVGDWLGFGRPREATSARGAEPRAREFDEFLSSIDGRSARLYFLHLLLPHMPFEYVPSGRRYQAPDHQTAKEDGQPLFDRASAAYADTVHQRHLAQVGYVDGLVGLLMRRLREAGVEDSALVVITADHGASYREGRRYRAATADNLSDIVLVPLLLKLPGQRQGEIIDRPVEIVDVLPTVLEALQASERPPTDGRSLFAEERPPRTFIFRGRANVEPRPLPDLSAAAAESLTRKLRRFGSGDSAGLYAGPGTRHLLGAPGDGLHARRTRGATATVLNADAFGAVDLARDPLPLYVRGAVAAAGPRPASIAIVVNDVVAALTQPYVENGKLVFGTLVPESVLRNGRNTVEAIALEEKSTNPG